MASINRVPKRQNCWIRSSLPTAILPVASSSRPRHGDEGCRSTVRSSADRQTGWHRSRRVADFRQRAECGQQQHQCHKEAVAYVDSLLLSSHPPPKFPPSYSSTTCLPTLGPLLVPLASSKPPLLALPRSVVEQTTAPGSRHRRRLRSSGGRSGQIVVASGPRGWRVR